MSQHKSEPLDLLVESEAGETILSAPGVGTFTTALEPGVVITPGQCIGHLTRLGHARPVTVPGGTTGRVLAVHLEQVREPVGYGTQLFTLGVLSGADEETESTASEEASGGLVFPAPQTGRFWHRPSPDDEPYITIGSTLTAGTVVGMVEVMKTFSTVTYQPGAGLPERAKVIAIRVADGGEVDEGGPLLDLESV